MVFRTQGGGEEGGRKRPFAVSQISRAEAREEGEKDNLTACRLSHGRERED